MKKHMKYFIVLITLLFLTISVASASDNTTTHTNTNTETLEQTTHTLEKVATSTEAKKIIKENKTKNIKTATKTVEVNNMDEFTTAINSAVEDSTNDEYIINLKEGTYDVSEFTVYEEGSSAPKITINGNKQTITGSGDEPGMLFINLCPITINQITFDVLLINECNEMTLNNVTLNGPSSFERDSDTKIFDSTITGESTFTGSMLLNSVKSTETSVISNIGSLTIENSLLNGTLSNSNNAKIILKNTTFGENFKYEGKGTITSDNETQLLPFQNTYNGNYTLENVIIDSKKTNNGNLTIINSNINGNIDNYGNLTIINSNITKTIMSWGNLTISKSTINGPLSPSESHISDSIINNSVSIQTTGLITFDDDVEFGDNCVINVYGAGKVIISDENKIAPYYSRYNGTYVLENINITKTKTNYGNLTLRNCILNTTISNIGNLTLDNVVFGEKAEITASGAVITDDIMSVTPYLQNYNGTYILENTTITQMKENYGNLTIRNSTINSTISNNEGAVLIIEDDVIFGSRASIVNNGEIITNQTTAISAYLDRYDGDYTLENVTVNTYKTNFGKLTLKNVTLNNNGGIDEYGDLIVKNSTLKGTLYVSSQYGTTPTLIFEDDVIFINPFKITIAGNCQIIINNTVRIAPYIDRYSGLDYLLENQTITRNKNSTTNLTIRNSTINAIVENSGNLVIENSTVQKEIINHKNATIRDTVLNNKITNTGTLILGDDVTFGTSFKITGSGKVITNNTSQLFPYMEEFTGEATLDLESYTKNIVNSGDLTIENSTLTGTITNKENANLIFKNSTLNNVVSNSGTLELNNVTVDSTIDNSGTLIISDDTVFGENFKITGNGKIIINDTQRVADYLTTYTGNIVLENKTINANKVNEGRLTLNNCTINSTIENKGRLIIDDNTVFGENAKITGTGEIVINDITKILPIIDTINGNYVINDTTLNKSYIFNGKVTLNNCTTNQKDNSNFGTLTLNNCSIDVGEDNVFLDNFGKVFVSKDTELTGKINDLGGETTYDGKAKTYVVNNRTITLFFDQNGIKSIVNPGDVLDFQGKIGGIPELTSIIVNKPVNITSTTKDAYIELNTIAGSYFGEDPGNSFTINKDGSYTNVTGIYFHNTQLWLYNTNHVTLDNISAVVENRRVGSGVGQTSIRANSSYITVKNSYFYTKENGMSSTLVLAWANYCDIINNTIIGGGGNGNLLYLTTYNIEIPYGALFNSYNNIINNTLIGPDTAADVCYGITISGNGNIIDGNTINYTGNGIMAQWGSGVTGDESEESAYNSTDNIVRNNKLYGGCGISGGHIIYNNYVEGPLSISKATAYNNTANRLSVSGETEIYNNTINGRTIIQGKNNQINNNTLKGNISITTGPINNTLTGNNITGTITLEGQNNTITNNRITTDEEYTITGKREVTGNIISDNYLQAANKSGKASINLRTADKNTIENNLPHNTKTSIKNNNPSLGDDLFIIVKVTDEDDKPLANAEVTLKVNDKEETLTTNNNGEIVYIYTPESEGNYTISAEFNANDAYTTSQNTTTVNIINTTKVVEDLKEELANTTQKADTLEKQLKDANQTINNQKTTLDNLNKTLTQTQKDLQNATKKITEQNQTINDLNKKVADANKKVDNLNKSNNDLNNKLNDANKKVDNLTNANSNLNKQLADADKKIDTLTKQNDDLEKQLADLNKKVDTLTKTVDTLNKTVAARDNTLKELTTKTSTKITVNKINTTTVGSTITVTGKVTDDNGKALNNMPVSIKINTATTKAVTNANGVYTYTTTAWNVGTSNVTVSSIANDKYTSNTAKTTFKVSKAKPVLKLNSISAVKYKDKVTVTGSLMDNNNKAINGAQITLKINSKSVNVKTAKDGSLTYTTSATSMGTNNVTATYNGNTKYNKVTAKTTFKVNKQNLILTVDRVASGLKYKDPLVVGGRLVDGNAKAVANSQVNLKFNGKTYKAKTDKNGYYKVTTRATTMDKNNLTVTYAGNKYYNKATAKTTFTVAKQDLVITFNTVKYSNGKVTISGTFTDRNRHALMNSLARITLNGKQGTAKTDKTGTFTYTTKANKGTYKVTLAYPGNARYNAYSKTSTVKTA
ncbi:Ig-like domain repeat protein (plasmid) [Methanosphaera sp. ISO3-F5]|uniref:Ig-like domain repeat protein n=1 Tax=Methanosphaera sp. ISO3-F5 TaxID=1452353 RepID=UPI002B257CD5|nr:Ig-like domain repeat protein [Methanosphaera sp. ISO3-F5]WQH65367.1 Ig-like domain repeat protein [Methanosphaera sp. ISO3-F5]